MARSVWEKVGQIGVDAGICWVGDPCYILHKTGEDKKALAKDIGSTWEQFCSKLNDRATVFGNGLGVCVETGFGDGTYNVWVRKTREGRIGAVKVVFAGIND